MRKRGLNMNDKNRLTKLLADGLSIEDIARKLGTYPDVIEKFLPKKTKKAAAKKEDDAPSLA